MKHLLSLCMIVKDEEKVIQRCLESVQGLVDEIVVVDTGSTDQTKEIAVAFTDKIYDFQWINDFSAARNESLSKATSKWILILDADEYLDVDNHQKIINFLKEQDYTQPQGFILPIINLTGAENSGNLVETFAVRIICNHPEVNFFRPIHEQIQYKQGDLPVQRIEYKIFHTGYTHETTINKNKRNRNLAIFDEMKKKNKFEEYDYFTLANEYDSLKDYKKALYYYQRADTKKSQNSSFIIHCKYKIITTLAHLGRTKEAFESIDECIDRWPNIIEFLYLKAHYLNALGFIQEASQILEHCIKIAEKQSRSNQNFWFIAPTFSKSVYKELMEIYLLTHNNTRTVTLITHLINTKSEELKDLTVLMQLLLQSDDVLVVASFLDKLYTDETETSTLRLFHASLIVGNPILAEYYYKKCSESNIEIDRIYKLHYFTIINNNKLFLAELNLETNNISSGSFNRIIGVGLCLWKDSTLLQYLIQTEDNADIIHTLTSIIKQNSKENETKFNINIIYQILIDLFNSEHYDTYDWLINKYAKHADRLMNLIGDYFYSKQKIELAFDYYSILLEKNQLSANGYENIAQYYMNSGNAVEALDFMKKAIELDPNKLHLYTTLLMHTTEKEDKLNYSKLFNNLYPQYQGVPMIKELLQ